MKEKAIYFCNSCGNEQSRWAGRCPVCGEWNSLVEAKTTIDSAGKKASPVDLITLEKLPLKQKHRLVTGISEFDRVMGGDDPGLVAGSVVLLAGSPGVGKSTLLLQIAAKVKQTTYFSAEESLEQIGLRARRLQLDKSDLRLAADRDLSAIIATLTKEKPSLAIIDSIQTVFDETVPGIPGSIAQVRDNCWKLQQIAKQLGTAIILVGHITKEGVIAGPKALEHLVDAVFYLEGERRTGLRLLRSEKNRFGPTDEVGFWQLTSSGFQPVDDPGKLFASLTTEPVPGRALSITNEGSRAFVVEIQALVSPTAFGYPKRAAQGVDLNRLNLLLAVLENRLALPLDKYDVFINVVGGFSLRDPGVDLAIAGAVLSGLKRHALPDRTVLIGEIGLLGEVRGVFDQARREKEAKRLKYSWADVGKTVGGLRELVKG